MKTENLISIYSDQINSAFYIPDPKGGKGGESDDPYICSLEENGKISSKNKF